MRTKKRAHGVASGNMMKLVCAFDIETWEQVRTLAAKEQTSVAEQVRKLVEWGLEADAHD